MKRYKYLDIARGIGLLLVIISHSCGLSSYLINYYIPLFFVVSGYIYKPGRSYGENIGRKAKRLLIPYFGYSAVLLAFYALMGRSMREMGESVFGVLYSRYCLYDTTTHTDNVYLFTVANGAMWYLTAFFVTSLVYHLVIDRCLASRKFLLGCAAVLIAVTMALAIMICNAFISAGLPSFTGSYADWTKTLIYLCEMTFTIALTVGSVKGAQSLTSKALGL